jgi:hypothetical protein
VVLDRSDNVVYRDVYPPVDLSDAGAPEREAMRRRGEFMMFMESDLCPRLEFFTGVAGSVTLRLEDTLAPTAAPAPETKAVAPATPATPAAPATPRRATKPRAN